MLLQISDVPNATADKLIQNIIEDIIIQEICVKDLHIKLVGICCDGVNVNSNKYCGLAALFRAESPSLVAIYCMNHGIELALKESFAHSNVGKKCAIFKCYSSKKFIALNTLHEVASIWYSFYS